MSVIQQIRDKYARWAVVAIALSLLGFIMMDAFAGRTSVMGNNSTTLGVINGHEIDVQEFEQKVKAQEEMAQQQGMALGEESRQQIIESVWNGEIDRALLQSEIDELGLAIGKKEINDILFGANPPQDLRQGFTDPQTGQFNVQAAQQYFANLRKSGTPEQKAQMNQYLESLELQRLSEKYSSLLGNSTYYAKWFVEKQNADNSLVANVSYITVPYATVSDSAVKVSDSDIQSYINERKDEFKQDVETRSINYIVFNASPSATDSTAVLNTISGLKEGFATATNAEQYLTQQGTTLPYFDGYLAGSKIQIPAKDSIFSLPIGGVYGPYQDGNSYVLAKKLDQKVLPDSARVRHILITNQAQPDSVAKRRIDSIALAIRGGANFDSLAKRFSEDPGSKDKGGVYEYFPQGQMVAAFNDFAFGKPVGTRDVVKTEFGYHLIEVLGQKGGEMNYKIAYLGKEIVPSSETDNAAANAANQFAGDSRSLKAFNENYDKNLRSKGYNRLLAADIRPNDFQVAGIGASRSLVKAIFEADKGDVLEPQRVGDNYVVAVVTEVEKEGVVSVAKARNVVEPILRNKKKAEQIKTKLGKISSLQAAATAANQPVQVADSLSFGGARNAALGYELKVVGAAFNPANKGKVVPEALEGQAGVYVVQVNNVSAVPQGAADINIQRQMLEMQARQQMMYRSPLQALRKSADIKDNRSKFY
ncbi:peptidylprolyl isomerase [Paracnuella aquatica]|uniref:peptidylprolyl isomerase n=1 Tax=Paracnuella aquatica TaxID=2268757 RepID=UPI000DF00AFD|nr:SurA N-terminal domain-containing protein [Paracnuella aquatica]RPD50928.1 peptidylprolyl isomerase [Paracnuella aquatica]